MGVKYPLMPKNIRFSIVLATKKTKKLMEILKNFASKPHNFVFRKYLLLFKYLIPSQVHLQCYYILSVLLYLTVFDRLSF